jgi:putative selenate reductase molybdopterin-binding subunit
MNITLKINGNDHSLICGPNVTLLHLLREMGFHGVKFGDEQGLSGSDTVLLDGKPVNAGILLAAQCDGHQVVTIESLGEHPEQGWRKTEGLHPIQQAFVESGAIQCGYCTPAQILAAKALLSTNSNPTETEVREALSGILCRCTGYLKPVNAVLKAAAVLRGEETFNRPTPNVKDSTTYPVEVTDRELSPNDSMVQTKIMPKVVISPEAAPYQVVGKPEIKVDAIKLAQGKPAFSADIEIPGMLHAKVLRSPHAHALIKRIDTTKAKALQGVAAVLTWQDIPRVVY